MLPYKNNGATDDITSSSSLSIKEDSAARLLGNLYTGYVQNRVSEMNRIDNTTGWTVAILSLILSFALGTNTPFYLVPFSLLFLVMFWFKESRRYVYYIFWSDKERRAEEEILNTYRTGKINPGQIINIIKENRPLELVSLKKALMVRYFRSYFWMTVIIFITTFILAYVQGAIAESIAIGYIFLFCSVMLLFLAHYGKDEFMLPRKVIMRPGISEKNYSGVI